MRLNTAANLAATAALLIVGVHLLSFEMSPEREDLDSQQLHARIQSVRAQADETRQLIAAMRSKQAVVKRRPRPQPCRGDDQHLQWNACEPTRRS